ncbi:MAG: Arc family DNA-binding protein [Flavipsychrobacter sp.]|nr:Arc family DNA-binding protein [Flavipsychrobacter sp.]
MADKKNFVLRLDEDVYKALEKWAADEFRSVNGQIEWLIDAALKKAGRKAAPKPGAKGKKDEA